MGTESKLSTAQPVDLAEVFPRWIDFGTQVDEGRILGPAADQDNMSVDFDVMDDNGGAMAPALVE
eukprot:7886300-Pyramimonas_sp.AAC.1